MNILRDEKTDAKQIIVYRRKTSRSLRQRAPNIQPRSCPASARRSRWATHAAVFERAVERGQLAERPRGTSRLGVDEKAIAKGHHYLTLVCALDRAAVEVTGEDRKLASLAEYFTGLS